MPISRQGTAYDLIGQKDAPVVVLIHGLGLTRHCTWGAIAPALAETFQVLSYDLLGHGETQIAAPDVTLTLLSQQLVALLDELGIARANLVGFSLGGMINRRVAIDHPTRVCALIILNSPHERSPQAQALIEARAKDTSAGGPAANLDQTLARWFTEPFRAMHADRVAAVRDVVLANDPVNYAAHRWVLASGVTELINPDPAISQPTLVITCENDTGSTPQMAHTIATEIIGAQTIIMPMLQHLGLLERPDLFTTALQDFLMQPPLAGQLK